MKCSHPVATNRPAGNFDMQFTEALTCAQKNKEYYSWKMEGVCDERYNHLRLGHLTDEPGEIDATGLPP